MAKSLAVIYLLLATGALGQVESLDPIVVSATRSPEPLSELPLTVDLIPEGAFSDGVSIGVDNALLASADFSLFRRNDSLTANPTSQGVSLRGMGPSGASRSLVLLDGVPINDPFGGWVAWSAIPVDSIAGAEILPNGGAAAWGDGALAGVVQMFSKQPASGAGDARAQWGSLDTRVADLAYAVQAGPGVLEFRGQEFATDGPILVAPESRGPVDIYAASRHTSASARWRGQISQGIELVATMRTFGEWRDNGTAYQQNESHSVFGSLALSGKWDTDESWNATAYFQDQGFSQTFSSINADRTAETPASDQFAVPTTALGFSTSSTWTGPSGALTTAGLDMRHISGETREDYSFVNGAFTSERMAGGEQDFGGVFLESSQPLGRSIRATAGVRVERWENDSGHMVESSIANGGVILDDLYPNRQGTELSPSAGLAWKASEAIELHVDGQRSFREPTLNELYRPFRQGSTTTLANPSLSTEHAESIEAGAALVRGQSRLTVEGFSTIIEDPVSNVTLAQGPGTFPLFGALPAGGAGQERLNLGRVDVRGAQLGYEWKGPGGLSLDLSPVDEGDYGSPQPEVAPDPSSAVEASRRCQYLRWERIACARMEPGGGHPRGRADQEHEFGIRRRHEPAASRRIHRPGRVVANRRHPSRRYPRDRDKPRQLADRDRAQLGGRL